MATITPFTVRGQRRNGGLYYIESASGDVAEHVEDRYRKGDQWLAVERNAELIGEITRHPDTGKRIWWAS